MRNPRNQYQPVGRGRGVEFGEYPPLPPPFQPGAPPRQPFKPGAPHPLTGISSTVDINAVGGPTPADARRRQNAPEDADLLHKFVGTEHSKRQSAAKHIIGKGEEGMQYTVSNMDDDDEAKWKKSARSVQIRKTIYSAAALNPHFWPTAFVTFIMQLIVLMLYFTGDVDSGNPFMPLGFRKGISEYQKFLIALGRFVSWILISSQAMGDLQNAINILSCTYCPDKLLGLFQLIIVLTYPLAWVAAISDSETIKEALGSTGILAIFLKLDDVVCSLLELGVMKREIGALVYTIENPLPPGRRETIMNLSIFTYAIGYWLYVWWVAMDFYWAALILWCISLFFFFRAFFTDLTDSEEGQLYQVVSGFHSFGRRTFIDVPKRYCCCCCFKGSEND